MLTQRGCALSLLALSTTCVLAQRNTAGLRVVVPMPDEISVYVPSAAVTAPEALNLSAVPYSDEMRQLDVQGTCVVAIIVGTDGIPRKPTLLHGFMRLFDEAAIDAVSRLRFKPGKLNGAPVDVEMGVEIEYSVDTGSPAIPRIFTLQSPVVPPILVESVKPRYPKSAKQAGTHGLVVVTMNVPENGVPTEFHVQNSLSSALDESAIEAVRQFRFKPATMDGKPLSTRTAIEVEFKLN